MRYARIISELHVEVGKLDEVIEALENIALKHGTSPMTGKAGRFSMGPAERRQVSARMKKYWSDKKNKSKADPKPNEFNARLLQECLSLAGLEVEQHT